jgi:hypothetical protein
MKARLTMGLAIAAAVFWAAACGHSCSGCGPRTDITLQGPWVLYQDKKFDNHGREVSVLIAIAPKDAVAMPDPGPKGQPNQPVDFTHHRPPEVSNGDGYPFPDAGIYCLSFDDLCGRKGPRSLQQGQYPDAALLKDYSSADWNWVKASNRNIAFILPMPDSYSSRAMWYVHFSDHFGDSYSEQQGPEHSIGLDLHYSRGPANFGIYHCKEDPRPSSALCEQGDKSSPLPNGGALQLVMRTPDAVNGCDDHVRFAYHKMLLLIDNKSLWDHLNVNQSIGYIDPAWQDSNLRTHFDYDNTKRCLYGDPQSDKSADAASSVALPHANQASFSQKLGEYLSAIKNARCQDEPGVHQADEPSTPCSRLQFIAKDLNPEFPRISELKRLRVYTDAFLESDTSVNSHASANRQEKSQIVIPVLPDLLTLLDEAIPEKTGSDCLAMPILVGAQP